MHANRNSYKILAIHYDSGNLVRGQRHCASVAVDYFQDFLGNAPPLRAASCNWLADLECHVISESQAAFLQSPVNRELIYNTMKKMKKNRVPGPDGFNKDFFLLLLGTSHLTSFVQLSNPCSQIVICIKVSILQT